MEAKKRLINIIKDSTDEVNNSKLSNPFYGKKIFFSDNCTGPKINRTTLIGYIGATSGTNKELSKDIDYCVIPKSVYSNLLDGNVDSITENIISLIHNKSDKKSKPKNTIPETRIITENTLFSIVYRFVKNDPVKMKHYNKLHIS